MGASKSTRHSGPYGLYTFFSFGQFKNNSVKEVIDDNHCGGIQYMVNEGIIELAESAQSYLHKHCPKHPGCDACSKLNNKLSNQAVEHEPIKKQNNMEVIHSFVLDGKKYDISGESNPEDIDEFLHQVCNNIRPMSNEEKVVAVKEKFDCTEPEDVALKVYKPEKGPIYIVTNLTMDHEIIDNESLYPYIDNAYYNKIKEHFGSVEPDRMIDIDDMTDNPQRLLLHLHYSNVKGDLWVSFSKDLKSFSIGIDLPF